MAKKKSAKQQSTMEKPINSPFKSLKGLSAFAPGPSTDDPAPDKVATADIAAFDCVDEQYCFADEMDSLGVEPLSERKAVTLTSENKSAQISTCSPPESDHAVFLDAVGTMEKVFKDEWPEETAVKPASARRMKQLERGQIKLQDVLDLHGLTVDEATVKVRYFLQNSIYRGMQAVLVITGKGLHSSQGPVLRQSIELLLSQSSEQVIEWGSAPHRLGGDGALVVFLRSPEVD